MSAASKTSPLPRATAVRGADWATQGVRARAQKRVDWAMVYERLTPQERLEADALLAMEEMPRLDDYIIQISPHLPPPPHVRLFTEIIEDCRRRRRKVAISWPPRHAKTTTVMHGFAWWLKHSPADTCAYFSYSDQQGRSKSRQIRNLCIEAKVEMMAGSRDMSEWRTEAGGGLLAGGVGGRLTGMGVSGLFVIDDPYKNRQDVESATKRETIWEWFNEVAMTRLEGASVVVIHTRWHPDDLIARLDPMPGWEYINLPAIAEDENDPIDRAVGDALWPELFPLEELERIRVQIGDWSFAALYQGRPQPRGSNVFKDPARYNYPQSNAEWIDLLRGKYLIIGVDPAASESTHADYSVAVALAADRLGPDATCWVLDVVRGQWTIPDFVSKHLSPMQAKWRSRLAVEAAGGFKAVPQMLKAINPNLMIVEIFPSSDKFQRAQPVAAAWNDGRVLVPGGITAPAWVEPFIREVTVFTGIKDPNDDQVDGLAHAFNTITNSKPLPPRGVRRSVGSFG